jgi:hypothetical protein
VNEGIQEEGMKEKLKKDLKERELLRNIPCEM